MDYAFDNGMSDQPYTEYPIGSFGGWGFADNLVSFQDEDEKADENLMNEDEMSNLSERLEELRRAKNAQMN